MNSKSITPNGGFTMYNSLSKEYASTKVLQSSFALIAAILLTCALILSLSERIYADPLPLPPNYTKQVTGRVTWADGSPAEDIRVQARGIPHSWHKAHSDVDGYYTLMLPVGTWQISIDTFRQYDTSLEDAEPENWFSYDQWHGAGLPYTIQFADDNSNETHMLDISLKRVNSLITGTLRSTDGTPITGVSPDLIDIKADSADYDKSRLFEEIDPETGVYTISVSSGTWDVAYRLLDSNSPGGYTNGIAEPISVTVDDDSTARRDLIIEEFDAKISGIILRTDTGEPVIDGSVSMINVADEDDYRQVDVGEDGRFQVVVPSGTTWELTAWWGQNLGPAIYPVSWEGTVEVAEAGVTELTIGGDAEMNPKQLTGQVTWEDGSPAEGIQVRVWDPTHQIPGSVVTPDPVYSDANGFYTMTVPTGRWEVYINTMVQYDLSVTDFDMEDDSNMYDQWYGLGIPHTVTFSSDDSDDTHIFNIGLRRVDSIIKGTLLTPSGMPLTRVGTDELDLWVNSPEYATRKVYTSIDPATGAYTVAVTSGAWNVTYGLKYPNGDGPVVRPVPEGIDVTVYEDVNVVRRDLIVDAYDATISGVIRRTDTGERVPDGQVDFTNGNESRSVSVDANGEFRVAVRSGTTWEIYAWWDQNSGSSLYPIQWNGIVEVSGPGESELSIGGIEEMNEAVFLPLMHRGLPE